LWPAVAKVDPRWYSSCCEHFMRENMRKRRVFAFHETWLYVNLQRRDCVTGVVL
jgi:hypothetical protein